MKKGYVWYSAGSDSTGIALAEALGFEHGKKTPVAGEYAVVIGWGAKVGTKYKEADFKKVVTAGRMRLLNPVEAIERNRNKLGMLQLLAKDGVMTPGILVRGANPSREVADAVKKGQLAFPLLGLEESNKGEPQFFYTIEDVAKVPATVKYFRSFVPGTEFRIHVIRDMCLLAQRKVQNEDPVAAYTDNLIERLERRASRDVSLRTALGPASRNMGMLRVVLNAVASDLLNSPNQLQRSLDRGWELTDVPLSQVPELARNEAVRALEVAGLDLGAVSVTLDTDNPNSSPAVTAITTGPALSPEHLKIYAEAISSFASGARDVLAAPKVRKVAERKAPDELTARFMEVLRTKPEKEIQRLLTYLES